MAFLFFAVFYLHGGWIRDTLSLPARGHVLRQRGERPEGHPPGSGSPAHPIGGLILTAQEAASAALSPALTEIGQRIVWDDHQNDHCTADPIFVVQQRKRIYGIEMDYDPQIVWLHGDEYTELGPEQSAIAEEYFGECGRGPAFIADGVAYGALHEADPNAAMDAVEAPDYVSNLRRLGYIDIWEFVQPFFTRQGAEAYIKSQAHRLTDPRVYVASAYRNPEWQGVREWLKADAL